MNKGKLGHIAALVAVVLVAIVIAGATGAVEIAAGVVITSAVVLHLGVFASLIALIVRRVRRDRDTANHSETQTPPTDSRLAP